MKPNKKSRLADLSVDVIEYMFIEWLHRQGIFPAFKANYEGFTTNHRSFRANLRDRLRFLCHSTVTGPSSLVTTAFPFALTREGYEFWVDKSNRWRQFCRDFRSTF